MGRVRKGGAASAEVVEPPLKARRAAGGREVQASAQVTPQRNGRAPRREEDVQGYNPLDFFTYYVQQVSQKHSSGGGGDGVHKYVRDHGFPPAGISEELNLKWVQGYLRKKIAGKDLALEVILMGAFQAPDQPFSFKETLPAFLDGVREHRKDNWRKLSKTPRDNRKSVNRHFGTVERVLKARYIRGIDPELIRSGERKGNVYGYGEVGIYNAEHQTSIMPGLTHPEGLRWKLEHWPLWLEKGVFPLLRDWPDCNNQAAVEAMLASRFQKLLPHGIETEIDVAPGGRRKRIVDLFGGDKSYATSALSQALLFFEMLKPVEADQMLVRDHGRGAGTFTVRGFWMAYHRDRTFKSLDTATFCPGFTGALKGAAAVKVAEATGVELSCADKGSINWSSWQTQLRFGAWLYALQEDVGRRAIRDKVFAAHVEGSGLVLPMHCSEVEASLCFMSRLVQMYETPESSMLWQSASKGIGGNMPAKLLKTLWK